MKYTPFSRRLIIVLSLFLGLSLSANGFAQSFSAKIDRNTIELGESVTLTLTYISTSDAPQQEPDLDILKDNFHIRSYYPSMGTYSFNGRVRTENSWTLALEPKNKGKILIPPLSYDGLHSQAIELTVKEADKTHLFLETTVDKSSAYVQEQVIVSFRLYSAKSFRYSHPQVLEMEDAIAHPLELKQYERQVDGRSYHVIEAPFAILPQKSGTLLIPSVQWTVETADPYGRLRRKRVNSIEKPLRVKPVPDSFPKTAQWLPARTLTIDAEWSKDTQSMKLGEPVTRTLKIEGSGIEGSQIPEILQEISTPQFKSYLETGNIETTQNEFGLNGVRIESAVYVASEAGTMDIPQVSVPWWNTQTDKLEYLTISAQTLSASGEAENSVPFHASTPQLTPTHTNSEDTDLSVPEPARNSASLPNNSYLLKAIYVLIASNLLTLGALIFLVFKQSPKNGAENKKQPSNENNQWKNKLKLAVNSGDVNKIYNALQSYHRNVLGVNSYRVMTEAAKQHQLIDLFDQLRGIEFCAFGLDDKGDHNFELKPDILFAGLKVLQHKTEKNKTKELDLNKFY